MLIYYKENSGNIIVGVTKWSSCGGGVLPPTVVLWRFQFPPLQLFIYFINNISMHTIRQQIVALKISGSSTS